MNKRIKVFLTSITLVLSMVVMVFSVLAASNKALEVDNYIIFDIEDNIACEIEAVTAIGTSPDVAFNSTHANSKTIRLSTSMNSDSGVFTYVSGNTTLDESGKWAPWTEEDPATLSYSADTIYWIYKITNKSDNNIQVRITDTNDKTLFTMNNNMSLFKKFGTSESTTPDQTDSGEIEKDQSVYVLIALETKNKTIKLEDDWNYKLHITKANASYLLNTFVSSVPSGVKTINFVGGTGEDYTGAYTGDPVKLGATDKTGATALAGNEEDYQNVNQIFGYVNGTTLTVHSKGPIYAPENCNKLFYALSSIESILFENFITSNVTNMSWMFGNCYALSQIDLQYFDTSSVMNMNGIFSSCRGFISLDVSRLNTSNVTNMTQMFYGCKGLTSLDVSNFDTSKVETMSRMFSECEALTALDLRNFNTYNVTSMSYMFSRCFDLVELNISSFNTSNVTSMSWMFGRCTSLTEIDLSSFNTLNVTDMSSMFNRANKLLELDLSNFYVGTSTKVSDMLNLQGVETSLAITTIITPYYVGVESGIDITGLGLSLNGIAQTTIANGYGSKTLTKAA